MSITAILFLSCIGVLTILSFVVVCAITYGPSKARKQAHRKLLAQYKDLI